ncbi:hypothetical protein G9A89_001434 [Geosiphon pyriformis]|nr:hypothetical protein G9A89_001434 [Geosiphon pyriformis]
MESSKLYSKILSKIKEKKVVKNETNYQLEVRNLGGFGKGGKNSPKKILVEDVKELKFLKRMAHLANIPYCFDTNEIGNGSAGLIADVVKDHETQNFIIFLRGPEYSKEEWDTRRYKMYSLDERAKIEGGWVPITESVMNRLYNKIITMKEPNQKSLNLVFIGHGVGGVYAVQMAMLFLSKIIGHENLQFRELEIQLIVVTFGQPRFANIAYTKFINIVPKLKIYRVTHANDHVPHKPKVSTSGEKYIHHETEYWILDKNCDCIDNGSEFELYKCPGYKKNNPEKFGENLGCNLSTNGLGVDAHYGPYFGTIFGKCESFYTD